MEGDIYELYGWEMNSCPDENAVWDDGEMLSEQFFVDGSLKVSDSDMPWGCSFCAFCPDIWNPVSLPPFYEEWSLSSSPLQNPCGVCLNRRVDF